MKTIARIAHDHTTQVVEYLVMPLSPWAPFVMFCVLVRMTRMISAKPSVAMAR